jgi:hypothetical protein
VVAVLAGAAGCADAADRAGPAACTPISVALTDRVAAVVPVAVAGGISLAGSLFCWAAVTKSCPVTVVAPKLSRPAVPLVGSRRRNSSLSLRPA